MADRFVGSYGFAWLMAKWACERAHIRELVSAPKETMTILSTGMGSSRSSSDALGRPFRRGRLDEQNARRWFRFYYDQTTTNGLEISRIPWILVEKRDAATIDAV
jgi:hypothetical protein